MGLAGDNIENKICDLSAKFAESEDCWNGLSPLIFSPLTYRNRGCLKC